MTFTIVLEPDDDGSILARCLELGAASCGDSNEEAIDNISGAIREHMAALLQDELLEDIRLAET